MYLNWQYLGQVRLSSSWVEGQGHQVRKCDFLTGLNGKILNPGLWCNVRTSCDVMVWRHDVIRHHLDKRTLKILNAGGTWRIRRFHYTCFHVWNDVSRVRGLNKYQFNSEVFLCIKTHISGNIQVRKWKYRNMPNKGAGCVSKIEFDIIKWKLRFRAFHWWFGKGTVKGI